MNRATEKQLKEYYREVSKAIVCNTKQKKTFMAQLKNDVDSFLLDSPDATIEEIKLCFGSAKNIAESFISSSDVKSIKKASDFKKILLIGIIVALLIYFAFVVLSLIDVHTEAHGYFREGLMLIDAFRKVALL